MNLITLKQLYTKLILKLLHFLPKISRQFQLVNPEIDEESELFSYFSKPIMQVGCRGAKKATSITPEGFLYTGALEIVFYTGVPLTLINQRIKKLYRGYLPLVEYDVKDTNNDITYSFKVFQYWLSIPKKSPLINHVLVKSKNNSNENKPASIGLGIKKPKLDHRPSGDFLNPGLKQNAFKHYLFEMKEIEVYCDDKLIYMSEEKPTKMWEKENLIYDGVFRNKSKNKACSIFQFDFTLDPGEEKTFYFKIPHYPIPKEMNHFIELLKKEEWNLALSKFEDEWKMLFEIGMYLEIPEKKVMDTSKTCLMFNLMCQEFDEEKIIQKVNRFQYNKFWIRDSSFFSRMYGIFGYQDIARRLLLNFLEYQDKDGNFLSQPGQLDGWGQTLWAFGEYCKLFTDEEFGRLIFPRVLKAINWLKIKLKENQDKLMPSTNAFDNELIMGKYTGHNFWALHGLEGALFIAELLKEKQSAGEIRKLKEKLQDRLLKYLRIFTKETKIIPPGLEFKDGIDWSNLLMIYPTKIFNPSDELVINTLNHYRKNKMSEGLSTWGPYLHHYVTERIAISELMLNHQRRVLNDFYSMLLHTGSCNEGFEMAIYPWGNRDYEIWIGPIKVMGNYPPHGWFACSFNTLLRMMLIREEDNELHLFSVLSPEWLQPDSKLVVKRARTRFGIIEFKIETDELGYEIEFKANWMQKPHKLLIHKPFFIEIKEILMKKGVLNQQFKEVIELEPSDFNLKIKWKEKPQRIINYSMMVERYKRNYKKIYELSRL